MNISQGVEVALSRRAQIYRSIMKRVLGSRTISLEELRLGNGIKSLPPILLPRGIEFQSVVVGGQPPSDGVSVPPGRRGAAVALEGSFEAEWVVPVNKPGPLVVMHLHGGGYVSGSPELYRMLTSQMAVCAGVPVFVPDYRLAPEHPFPAALEDARIAWQHLLDMGYDTRHIALTGDSAGGGLALSLVQSLRDEGRELPAALVLMSPWTDLPLSGGTYRIKAGDEVVLSEASLGEWASMYAGNTPLADPGVSPLFGRLEGLPPMLVQVGTEELLLDDSVRLAEKAKAAGVDIDLRIWEGLWHVWQMLGSLVPENEDSFAEIATFLRKHLTARPGAEQKTEGI